MTIKSISISIYIYVCINFNTALYYLISWPEEDDVKSVVAGQMIVSPPVEELIQGAMCKVKGFEKNLSRVVAAGTKAEMNTKLNEMEDNSEDEATEPPKKKARLEGKENKATPKPKPSKRRPQNKKEPGRYYILRAWCVCVCVCVYTHFCNLSCFLSI